MDKYKDSENNNIEKVIEKLKDERKTQVFEVNFSLHFGFEIV